MQYAAVLYSSMISRIPIVDPWEFPFGPWLRARGAGGRPYSFYCVCVVVVSSCLTPWKTPPLDTPSRAASPRRVQALPREPEQRFQLQRESSSALSLPRWRLPSLSLFLHSWALLPKFFYNTPEEICLIFPEQVTEEDPRLRIPGGWGCLPGAPKLVRMQREHQHLRALGLHYRQVFLQVIWVSTPQHQTLNWTES